jgi:pimeloyl-ACP methyl ester carboxylesterase/DNA-binding NarL/FixJ family response regulator
MQLFEELDADPAGLMDLIRRDPEAFRQRLAGLDATTRFPLLRGGFVSTLVMNGRGKTLHATGVFAGPSAPPPEPACIERARANRGLAQVDRVLDDKGETTSFVAYASAGLAAGWQLPAADKAVIARHPSAVVAVSTNATAVADDLLAACFSYGLTDFQARLIVAVVRTGSIKAAAGDLGVAHVTAREAVALALKASGAKRLPALIEMITTLAAGIFPQGDAGKDFVLEATGLTPRQLALTTCLSAGLTRTGAAHVVGVSEAVAKKEIDQVHHLLGTRSAASLARRLTEIRALAMLTDVGAGDIAWDDEVMTPTRFITRPDGSRIAFSDYGPRSGRPVLVLHSSMTTRPVASALLAALHARRFRVLAMDRPGYGLTEPPNDQTLSPDTMPDIAAEDVLLLTQRLKLKTIDLVARGAVQTVAAVHRRFPELLGRVALINPDLPANKGEAVLTPLRVFKEAFLRRPELISTLAAVLPARLSPQSVQKTMLRSLIGCEADTAVANDPRSFADYYRSVRPFATGRMEGFACEQAALIRHPELAPLAATSRWTILLGRYDRHYTTDHVEAYWRAAAPEAALKVVEGAGRLLVMTHPEAVAAALS